VSDRDCVFCKIIHGTEDAKIVATWPDALAIVPIGPVTPGHILIIPHAHVTNFVDDPVVSAAMMARAAQYVRGRWERDPLPPPGFNLITSQGEAATQSVFHLHLHLIPRRMGDQIKLPWVDQEKHCSTCGRENPCRYHGDNPSLRPELIREDTPRD
jgi:histidine triad (HIT) family protein